MSTKEQIPSTALVTQEIIERKIYLIRGIKVMLDRDLAALYGVPTKALNQAVRRNPDNFPEDFMFQLTKKETQNWKSQFVTSNLSLKMGLRRNPYAFTEQGIAMLSTVLKSKTAIQMNIRIMRSFIRLRRIIATNELIRQKLEELERKTDKHDQQIEALTDAIRGFFEKNHTEPKKEIGFHTHIRKGE